MEALDEGLGSLGGQESFEGSFKTDLWPGRAKGADFRFERFKRAAFGLRRANFNPEKAGFELM